MGIWIVCRWPGLQILKISGRHVAGLPSLSLVVTSRDIWINALNQLSRIGSKPHYRRCSMLGMHSLRPSSGSTVVAAMWRIACTDGSSNGWFSQLGRHLEMFGTPQCTIQRWLHHADVYDKHLRGWQGSASVQGVCRCGHTLLHIALIHQNVWRNSSSSM